MDEAKLKMLLERSQVAKTTAEKIEKLKAADPHRSDVRLSFRYGDPVYGIDALDVLTLKTVLVLGLQAAIEVEEAALCHVMSIVKDPQPSPAVEFPLVEQPCGAMPNVAVANVAVEAVTVADDLPGPDNYPST